VDDFVIFSTSIFRRMAARVGQGSARVRSEDGFGLIEVIISALLVALIVIATLNGFDVTSRATADERARSQADTLAQQAEDKLRGMPISQLETYESKPLVETITQNGTTYTITTKAEYHLDSSVTASCNSTAGSVGYYLTTSTVDWPSRGVRKSVTETGVISPPPGSALIVQVTNAASEGVPGMTVIATGPLPGTTEHTLATAANGCAVLTLLPGEYSVNVKRAGYVDQNWYESSKEDPTSVHSVYLVAETSAKEPYRFDAAGTLEAEFSTEAKASEGDTFVAFNSLMNIVPPIQKLGTLEKYEKIVKSSAKVFPFTAEAKYVVYAGTCEADNPKTVNAENELPEAVVPSGGATKVTVTQPPINIRVWSGKSKASPGKLIENAIVTLTDKGCETKHESKTNAKGGLVHPGAPFGEYSLCVTGGKEGGVNKEKLPEAKGLAKERKYTTTFKNDTAAGPSELATMTNGGVEIAEGKKFAYIYMESGAVEKPAGQPTAGSTCP
jgi:Tfp pilus assembly protein PilV